MSYIEDEGFDEDALLSAQERLESRLAKKRWMTKDGTKLLPRDMSPQHRHFVISVCADILCSGDIDEAVRIYPMLETMALLNKRDEKTK